MTLAVDFSETVSGTTLTLTLTVAAAFTGTTVDTFSIDSLSWNTATASYMAATGGPLYTAVGNQSPAGTLNLAGFAGNFTGGGIGTVLATVTFALHGGAQALPLTNITGTLTEPPSSTTNTASSGSHADVPCFAEGTLIQTSRGRVAVEDLRPGDLLRTILPEAWAELSWIGHRQLDCARHPRPHDIMPVLIRQDAFAPGIPARDLRLSPDHAIFAGGVLIPARHLLNGATLLQQNVARIRYFHIELDRHAVLLAENLPAESYLDTGNRAAFANGGGATLAHPDFARGVWQTRSCAPLVLDGPVLAAQRALLLDRAASLGHRSQPAGPIALWVDGQVQAAQRQGDLLAFDIPANATTIRLVCPSVVPAQRECTTADHRRLGIAVSRIRADGTQLALDDTRLGRGWHAPEPGWRWTSGDAWLHLSGTRRLEVEVALVARCWAA